MSTIQQILQKLLSHADLSAAEMTAIMQVLMHNELTPAQAGAFLIALRMKGESITEITAAANVARGLALPVRVDSRHLVDIVGTGGDQSHLFNVSTASAFVAAAAGARVAKHNNRSISSHSGSADALELAGIKLDLSPEKIADSIDKLGIGFMFAPLHHAAWKHLANVRRELGVRTIFNLLGPLTNPAQAPHALIGVYAKNLVEPIAAVLAELGLKHALVVHSDDGLDEISCAAPTFVAELKSGIITTYQLHPKQFDIEVHDLDSIRVQNPHESLQLIETVFTNQASAARDIVILNAGAAIYAADLCKDITTGITKAAAAISSGAAHKKWLEFKNYIVNNQA